MKLVLATRNPGKVAELRQLLGALPVTLVSAADVPGAPEVDEDADTLDGNARKKAVALLAHAGLPSLADDTGLEVDALDGRPGVRSARYAGEDGDAAANRAKLLRELGAAADRRARFRTVLAFADTDGTVRTFDGVCEGRILNQERGAGGFGYDALFAPDDGAGDETFAEMDAAAKNAISHRGRALRQFAAWLEAQLAERA